MSGPVAAETAGITYRQLDYWERKGWVTASTIQKGVGGRRLRHYSVEDVVRLAALRHIAQSGLDVGEYGPLIGTLEIPSGSVLIVGSDVKVAASGSVGRLVTEPGRWTVFDPAATRRAARPRGNSSRNINESEQRSA